MLTRSLLLSLAVLVPTLATATPTDGVSPLPSTREVDRLLAQADRHLALHTFDARRVAIGELERACSLEPDRADLEIKLARTYADAGFTKQSRLRFERALKLAPEDADARVGLGQAWRRDWLKYLERRSLDRAIEHFMAAGRQAPGRPEAWLMLSALEVEKGDLATARAAAEHALEADPGRADCQLAGASLRWRQGDVSGADSMFRLAFTRLRRSVRDRFEDFAPLVTEKDTAAYGRLPQAQRADFVRRFWTENDPDLGTPENEAQLEYWARVAQAYFLFYDPARREWDERGEIYVRYGPPTAASRCASR